MVARTWLAAARGAILDLAAARDAPASEFACTFLGAVVDESRAILMQVGDGVIVYRAAGAKAWLPACWPQHGEYRNETVFLTDNAFDQYAHIGDLRCSLELVALASDGLEDLCLHRAARRVVAAYFETLFATLQGAGTDEDHQLSAALERYLRSDVLNEHTDDDKTLILAARRSQLVACDDG